MPVPVKSGLFVADVMIPIADGLLVPALWQGMWLGEHRDR